jgi:hypothetical protein
VFENQDSLIRNVLLDDKEITDPSYDPYLKIGLSITKNESSPDGLIQVSNSEIIRSFLVPNDKKKYILENWMYGSLFGDDTYFDDDGNYHSNDIFEHDNILVENIIYYRYISELELGFFEPSEKFVLYHNLYREGNIWIHPYDKEKIIEIKEDGSSWGEHEIFIEIRKGELKNYLAARKLGLLLLRFSESICESKDKINYLPDSNFKKSTRAGHKSFICSSEDFPEPKYIYHTRLFDSFWIDPASKPKRWDFSSEGEFKGDIHYVFDDGESGTFFDPIDDEQQVKRKDARYFQVLSFKPIFLNTINSTINHSVEFVSLSIFDIRYPDGQCLNCCINSQNQIQAFFGSVAKLNPDKQRFLAGFSEIQKARISTEYILLNIHAELPPTIPFEVTLSRCLNSINTCWFDKYGETLLLSPEIEKIPLDVRLGCGSNTIDELIDVMLEIRKMLIPEGNITKIKQDIDISNKYSNKNDYDNAKSISYLHQLFLENGIDPNSAVVLKIIEDLRHLKSHPKNKGKILSKYSINEEKAQEFYYHTLSQLCKFILDFRKITEDLLKINISNEPDWIQIEYARKYFFNPF